MAVEGQRNQQAGSDDPNTKASEEETDDETAGLVRSESSGDGATTDPQDRGTESSDEAQEQMTGGRGGETSTD